MVLRHSLRRLGFPLICTMSGPYLISVTKCIQVRSSKEKLRLFAELCRCEVSNIVQNTGLSPFGTCKTRLYLYRKLTIDSLIFLAWFWAFFLLVKKSLAMDSENLMFLSFKTVNPDAGA
ncbi:hypothetical protein [Klebsiella quasipneumoniae]|uniref:hypothetical protein n=1 Tax=Klebsiella quasipneumoniae TaxID=1463165 RepID=UPI00227186E0|nr:hypothetical protein [Klebsiella quasipneumoniae]MCY0049576.1 hypothetical protein [Klebsiella quasipneumoniae]